ncbi:MAG TPA: DNA-formamidopyrimidine glycosylase family protein, partial [Chloroflexota bacterium]|nr:DNA-formamidopyrimidine glycosylase family protein [Chloroflexota bacterium]
MPELPEVESLVRDLSPSLVGRTILDVEVHKPKLFNVAPGLSLEDLFGRTIERLWRRGKLSVWELSDGLS